MLAARLLELLARSAGTAIPICYCCSTASSICKPNRQSRSATAAQLPARSANLICNPDLLLLQRAQKSSPLYNICQHSGVGSNCGRGDLHYIIFNSSDIRYVSVLISSLQRVQPLFTLLSQSPSYHYPRDEECGRIAFLLLAQSFSFYYL